MWFPQLNNSDIFAGGFYTLELTNFGNTEIKSFEFSLSIVIKNSQESIDIKKLVSEETKTLKVKLLHILKKGETIKVPLFSTTSYPIFEINTTGKYMDVRGQTYQTESLKFNSENSHLQ